MFKKEEVLPVVDAADVARKLKLDYSRGIKDQNEKAVEAVNELWARIWQPEVDMRTLAKETCEMICKRFGIASAGIALRSPIDGLYRYEAVVGLSEESSASFMKICYNKEQLLDPTVYKSYEISKYSKLFLGEDHPYAVGEESTYVHPGLIGIKRRALTDSLEADYIDTFIPDESGEIAGYIEITGTRLRKLPDTTTIKWMEHIAFMLGAAMRLRTSTPKETQRTQ